MEREKTKGRRTDNRVDLSTMVYGKVPPQAKDLEKAVLGCVMLDKNAYDVVAELLYPECFYVDANQRVYKAILSLAAKSQPTDLLTVKEELKAAGDLDHIGGEYYLATLTDNVVSSANVQTYARIIMEKYILREMITFCGETIQKAYEEGTDPFELLDESEEKIGAISQLINSGDLVRIDTVLVQAFKQIEAWRVMDTTVTGVPSGFPKLDQATRGWQNGDLIILAARPSVGKTALALELITNAAEYFLKTGGTVGVWSLEMKAMMLVLRMISSKSEEFLHKIQTGRLTEEQMGNIYRKGIQALSRYGIVFDDNAGLTMQKLRSKARKLKRKNKLGLIVLDYLQLMTSEERSGTREQEVSKISRNLKNLAQELNVPIIALSQLSREIEKRTGANRKPQLSDLRESGSIEQDADVVAFLWGPTEEEMTQDADLVNRRYLKIAKQRNGVLITVDLDFRDEIQKFGQVADSMPKQEGSWRRVDDLPKLYTSSSDRKENQEDYF